MATRIISKIGLVVSLKLRDDLYTIGHRLTSTVMRFYDVHNTDGDWSKLDLDSVESLFSVFAVDRLIIRHLAVAKLGYKEPIIKTDERYWIKPYTLAMDGHHYKGDRYSPPFLGGRIIDLGGNLERGSTQAPTIKEDLSVPDDNALIEKYEMTNMWAHEDLADRLTRYFDTGINRDDLKFEAFPGLWNDMDQLRPLTRRLPVPLR